MRVIFVVNSMPRAAGVTTFCIGVLNGLSRQGVNVYLALKSVDDQLKCIGLSDRVRIVTADWLMNSCVIEEPTVVHINGLWCGMVNRIANWAKKAGYGVCWSPHGMLMPSALKVSRIKKILAWHLYQRRNFFKASVIHATTEFEKDELYKLGIHKQVATIPLGIDTSLYNKSEKCNGGDTRRLLFVGRIDPIKGLDSLIEAIAKIVCENGFRDIDGVPWRLRIIGPDNSGYLCLLKRRARALGVLDYVEFVPARYGDELIDEYLLSDAVVLPSISENFGSTILEGMAAAKPVIATKGTPWSCVEEATCGFWVEGSVFALKKALDKLMKLSQKERCEMGCRGRAFTTRKYDWNSISGKFIQIYEEIA